MCAFFVAAFADTDTAAVQILTYVRMCEFAGSAVFFRSVFAASTFFFLLLLVTHYFTLTSYLACKNFSSSIYQLFIVILNEISIVLNGYTFTLND